MAATEVSRPKLLYNSATRKFVLWFKYNIDHVQHAGVAQSDAIGSKYTFVRAIKPQGNRSGDLTLYTENGVGYLVSSGLLGSPGTNMNIYRLTPDYLNVESTVAAIPWNREAPALFKRNDVYFLITSGRSGWKANQQMYRTATRLAGPWSEPKPIGNANGYGGQTTYVQEVAGRQATSWLWMADEWKQPLGGSFTTSTHKWLPLRFPDAITATLTDAEADHDRYRDGRGQVALHAALLRAL